MAQFDQRWPDQAGFGAVACAAFLKNGVILPNTQTLKAVMKDGVAQAREELEPHDGSVSTSTNVGEPRDPRLAFCYFGCQRSEHDLR